MNIQGDFEGRSALITGAASGIGAACARLMADRGASKLYLVDIDEDALASIDLPCDTHLLVGSVADPALWEQLERDWDNIDHAIVNAGIAVAGPITDLTLDDWQRTMAVNLDGAFLTLAAAMRAMDEKGGSAVVVASTAGIKPLANVGPYGVSKAAVAHMARIAAAEGVSKSIRVNAIAPGGVDTNIWDSSEHFRETAATKGREAAIAQMASGTPTGRFATAEEMADTILYLLSDASSNMTGHVLVSDGGFTL